MRHILFILFTLFILLSAAGCISNEEPIGKETYVDFNIKILTRGNGENGSGDKLNMSSVRIILFDKQGNCVVNTKYTTFEISQDETENTIIKIKDPISFTSQNIREEFDIYAVLNDESNFHSSTINGQSLSTCLEGCKVGTNCQSKFLDLLHTPLIYSSLTEITSEEPSFVMCAHKERVTIPDYTTWDNPYTIDLSKSETDENFTNRTMAIIYIDKITSDDDDNPNNDQSNDLSSTSCIFVTNAELINVPAQYVWNDDENKGNGLPLVANFFKVDTDEEGYIKNTDQYRSWSGTLTQTFKGSLYQEGTCEKDFRCWREEDNKGVDAWAIGYYNSISPHPLTILDYNNAQNKRLTSNNGNFVLNMISKIVTELTAYDKYEDKMSDLTSLAKDDAVVSNNHWDIHVNQGWYVPENISTSSLTATAIKISLVIAKPEIILPDEDIGDSWMDYVDWGKDDGWKYYSEDNELTDIGYDTGESFLKTFARVCWHNNIENIDIDGSSDGYHCFIGGLSRRRYGDIDETFTTDINNGINASWQIPQGSITAEFIIPINNADFDDDYSIRRNWRYNVTLRVNKDTFEQIKSDGTYLTRSSANSSPIKVNVERIKLSEP